MISVRYTYLAPGSLGVSSGILNVTVDDFTTGSVATYFTAVTREKSLNVSVKFNLPSASRLPDTLSVV